MEVLLIGFSILYIILIIIGVIALTLKKEDIILTRVQWVELIAGVLLLGIFLGLIKSNILNTNYGPESFLVISSFFLLWYLATNWITNLITIQDSLYSDKIKDKINNTETDIHIEKEEHENKKGFSYYITFIVIIAIVILLTTLLPYLSSEGEQGKIESLNKSTFYLLTFFVVISILIPFINRSRIEKEDRYNIYSYTFSFFLFGAIFIPIFVFDQLNMKNSVITTLLVFTWLSMTKVLARYLTAITTNVSAIKYKEN